MRAESEPSVAISVQECGLERTFLAADGLVSINIAGDLNLRCSREFASRLSVSGGSAWVEYPISCLVLL